MTVLSRLVEEIAMRLAHRPIANRPPVPLDFPPPVLDELAPGAWAPGFSLPDAEMEMFSLSALKGRKHVVLYFYPRDNTPGGTLQAAEFSDHEDEFVSHGCMIVGVSPDDCMTHASFRDHNGLSVRLLADTEHRVARKYGVWRSHEVDGMRRMAVMRTTFIIDREGVIRHVLRDVIPRGHAVAVLKLVKELDT
jgi:peroxiredoxin Q/BCP